MVLRSEDVSLGAAPPFTPALAARAERSGCFSGVCPLPRGILGTGVRLVAAWGSPSRRGEHKIQRAPQRSWGMALAGRTQRGTRSSARGNVWGPGNPYPLSQSDQEDLEKGCRVSWRCRVPGSRWVFPVRGALPPLAAGSPLSPSLGDSGLSVEVTAEVSGPGLITMTEKMVNDSY